MPDHAPAIFGRTITLVISGGIAAYKALELIRLLRKGGARVVPVLTKGGAQFVTPLSVAALAEEKVYGDLFSLTDEQEMGHIRLARLADLVVVAPASADLLAKMAQGLTDDLASTLLLATTAPVLVAPAMNPAMWSHAATKANLAMLQARGVHVVGPAPGETACGEEGRGRLAEPAEIYTRIAALLAMPGPLAGRRALITAGPTQEPVDAVRFLGNRSSGKQGYAIAAGLAKAGASVTLVSGPVTLAPPPGVRLVSVSTALEMQQAVQAAVASAPIDIAVLAAAVADWRVASPAPAKLKKVGAPPTLELIENPDILAELAESAKRPRLLIGFAAEASGGDAQARAELARAKLARKGCDWLLANDVSQDAFGGAENQILFLTQSGTAEAWPRMAKTEVATWLLEKIVKALPPLN